MELRRGLRGSLEERVVHWLPISEREAHEAEKAFWQQFQVLAHSELLNHQMKQLVELLRRARQALQDHYINLWPAEVLPTSFLALLAWL